MKKQGRLGYIKALIASVPEGQALLDLAQENNVGISFNPKLSIFAAGQYLRDEKHIELNPFLRTASLVKVLAHELRHMWQMQQLGGAKNLSKLTPDKQLQTIRLLEGDAFVFENYMAQQITRATGVSIKVQSSPDNGLLYKPAPAVDLATAEGQRTLFDRFQSSNHCTKYDASLAAKFKFVAKKRGLDFIRSKAVLASFTENVGDVFGITSINQTPYFKYDSGDRFLDSLGIHNGQIMAPFR